MNWFDVALVTALYVITCIIQAAYQAKEFSDGDTISHFWHAVFYAGACLVVGFFYATGLSLKTGICVGLYGGFVRLAFFDVILNSIRGKELWYNDSDPRPESLTDWWENTILRINESGGKRRLLILKICYLIIWAACVPLIYYICN